MTLVLVTSALLLATGLAGCLSDSKPTATPDPEPDTVDTFRPRVVVAIIDTGLMPYHDEFEQLVEDPYAYPGTYLNGYPLDVPAINLTLNETDLEKARKADEGAWAETTNNKMYWIPGTKVVGFIAIGDTIKLPGGGHGTMTSSRATGNTVSIPGPEVLLVNVYTPLLLFNKSPGDAVRWAADQPFIDIQSNSWGTPFMCVGPATESQTGWIAAFKYASKKQPTFVAVHNGHANFGTLGYPSQCQDTAGPADVYAVGGNDNGGLVRWSNWMPYISADACRNPTADESKTKGLVNQGGGTSSATPFSAGGAAKILLEARRTLRDPNVGVRAGGVLAEAHEGAKLPASGPLADGKFTMDELRQVMFQTALSPPTVDPSDGDPCGAGTTIEIPPGATPETLYPFIGYGEINHKSVARALEVLNGTAPMPVRSNLDAMYNADYQLRKAIYG
jgi:hypothetical protein